ncbi:universal stress protein [Halostagnicola sp. A-GB9-2]|uniref:universal stress protein n=1 Tax=Halostagnicola sp. A-GB9-2 TaxID=3048066 RepID=UPI0024BF2EBD|nr:universal stress protein [Halostagnicola sp. A-GB9-2]MDJ1432260.1 universal stress protein [Halostagnicola sp. A-GB9-2]
MYDHILVAIDDSDSAENALEHAISLAKSTDAIVHVLTVVETTTSPMTFGVEQVDELNEAASRLVEETREAYGGNDLQIRVDILRGKPSDTILEYAEEIDADLLVVGQRGTSGLTGAIIGSTTERLSKLTTTPMTIVPRPETDN